GFDPSAPQVPVAERPDIDRWILSDLQGLIRTARESFERYDVMSFCLEAEKFVDERLSNWYVRRNRDRFWSKNAELDAAGKRDKLAAYQTLYAVLTTLAKLIAPVVPFLAEAMWRNLRTDSDPESIHLCDYPAPDESLIDRQLSADMDALLRLVSLGGAARNAAKHKVRQPLAELRVGTSDAAEMRAVARFGDQLREELNVKAVTLRPPDAGPMLRAVVKLNKKSVAAKLGPRLKEAEEALARMNGDAIVTHLRNGPVEVAGLPLGSGDLTINYQAAEGWAGVSDKGTEVTVDVRI